MKSGGDLLLGGAMVLPSILIPYTGVDGRQQLRCTEPPKGLLRNLEQFLDQRYGGHDLFIPLGRGGPQPHGRERRLRHIRRSEMVPMLPRELQCIVLEPISKSFIDEGTASAYRLRHE